MEEKQNLNDTIKNGVCGDVFDDYIINCSGLFNWNSTLSKDTKLEMLKFFNNLSELEKEYVMNFRKEAEMDENENHYSGW
jgi:isocitrate lyase